MPEDLLIFTGNGSKSSPTATASFQSCPWIGSFHEGRRDQPQKLPTHIDVQHIAARTMWRGCNLDPRFSEDITPIFNNVRWF